MAAVSFAGHANADFSGSDSLAAKSSKWALPFPNDGGGKLAFANSRLEYLVKTPTKDDLSILRWTPNQGGYDDDWYVQVNVHMATFSMDRGGYTNLNLGVVNSENFKQGFMVAIDRYRNEDNLGKYYSGIEASSFNDEYGQYAKSNASDATLRMHFDSSSKTLTTSWKTVSGWSYFKPVSIASWGMDSASTFTAVLGGGGGNDEPTGTGPVIASGKAYYSNFKAGTARPDIAVEQPSGSGLTDGSGKRSFGTATIGEVVSKTFLIRNEGTAKLRNLKISRTGNHASDFTIGTLTQTVLAPGGATTFKVAFRPSGNGTRSAAIHISSNDPDESPFDILIAGEGVK